MSKDQSLPKAKKKWQCGCKPYKNLPEDEIEKLGKNKKNIIKWEKLPYYNYKEII